MSELPGMLSVEALAAAVSRGEIDTVVVFFTDLYGRAVGKRYDAGFFVDEALAHGAHACDYLLTVDLEMEPVAGYEFANWERGYGDVHLLPDPSTLRVASWLDRTAMIGCDVAARGSEELLELAPRSVLKRQAARAAGAGFRVEAASELEFFLYDTPYREAAERGWRELRPAGWYLEDYHVLQGTRVEGFVGAARRHLRDSGVPVETSKGEWGRGQHELNVRHAEVVTMADRHVVYKQCLKELAIAQGRSVTFMAKVDAAQAGSSCHVHMSLWKDGANAFPGEHDLSGIRCSDVFRWFLGGWIEHVGELMVFLAPTVNSYKRFRSASWAPTRLAWSHDNRTAAFRVVGSGPSLRVECRLPGADCNPYLAFAALLAAGLEGIERRIEPPPMYSGNAYEAKGLASVPPSLAEAAERFAESPLAARAFGEATRAHYAHFYRSEAAAYDRAVTDWERARYFEQI